MRYKILRGIREIKKNKTRLFKIKLFKIKVSRFFIRKMV